MGFLKALTRLVALLSLSSFVTSLRQSLTPTQSPPSQSLEDFINRPYVRLVVAKMAREHNDANVLALPARFVDEALALRIVDAFLAAHFEGGRHQRRVEKIEPATVQRS